MEEKKEEDKTKTTENDVDKTFLVEQKAQGLQEKYGERFDKNAYVAAATSHLLSNKDLSAFDEKIFIKDKKDDEKDKGKDEFNNGKDGGLSFHGGYENGKYIARGPNGKVIEGKDFAEVEDKVCAELAKHAVDRGEERRACFYTNSPNTKEKKEIFAKSAIKHGLAIGHGWPEDAQFWQDLKKDYLADKKHNLGEWERMTRKIPDEIMQRTPEEQARNKKLNDADLLKALRQGKNPLTVDQADKGNTSPQEQQVAPQNQNASQNGNSEQGQNQEKTQDLANGSEPKSDGINSDAQLINQMRHGVNPNVPETMPAENIQRQGGATPALTQEQIMAAVRRQASKKNGGK